MASSSIRIAVLTGSSATGRACIQKLLSKTDISKNIIVRGCFRTDAKATSTAALDFFPPTEEKTNNNNGGAVTYESYVGVDASNTNSLREAFKDVQRAFIVTPLDYSIGLDQDAQKSIQMMEVAKEMGVQRIIHVGSWTVHAPNDLPILSSRFLPTEQYLQNQIDDNDSSMEWTVLRGGYFMMNYLHTHAESIKNHGSLLSCPEITVPPVHTKDIGHAGASLLLMDNNNDHDDDDGNVYSYHKQMVECCGPELLSNKDVAQIIGKSIGKSISYEEPAIDLEQWCSSKSSGRNPIFAELFRYIVSKNGKGIPYDTTTFAQILGRSPTSFMEFMKEHKNVFLTH